MRVIGLISFFAMILYFVVGVSMIRHEDHTKDRFHEEYARAREGTDAKREWDLFLKYWVYKVEEDGTPIPFDKTKYEVWWLVEKQLKKEGLRLSPDMWGYKYYKMIRFDENGYEIKNQNK